MNKHTQKDFDYIMNKMAPIPGWFPLEVQIEITYDCTLRCPMCYNSPRAEDKQFEELLCEFNCLEMTDEKIALIEKLLDTCIKNGSKFFTITGGEPLLYPDLVVNMIKRIKARGCYASINTNSTVIDAPIAARLAKAGLDSALTSIHGPDEKTHAKTVLVKNAFERTISGIGHLLANKIHVVPNFVASHVNVGTMFETGSMLYNMGIKKQAYSIFIPTPGIEQHVPLTMTEKDYAEYFLALEKLNKTYPDINATATLPVPPCLAAGIVDFEVLRKFEFRSCPSGRQFMVVNVDGNISPCIQYPHNPKYGGNIIDDPKGALDKMVGWKTVFNTPEKCMDCGAKTSCNPCNMNILVNNENKLGPLSEPYPGRNALSVEDAKKLEYKHKINVELGENDLNKFYEFKPHVLFRQEKGGYLTVINPKIQGYTVLNQLSAQDAMRTLKIEDAGILRLLKAMNVLDIAERPELAKMIVASNRCVEKYKILTEFIGKDFNDSDAVYVIRTDTAGRFFCSPNTSEEKSTFNLAEKIYRERMGKTN
ncbi:MAG: radical SAM protein [Alphaproteobacteria bacterium]|nr:radical SAM protein [Alphaproteobacteria bacterium]